QPSRRSVQSVAVHLISLGLSVRDGTDPELAPALRRRIVQSAAEYVWLDPPVPNGTLTVADVHATSTARQHREASWAWARDVWQAWEPHHQTVDAWLRLWRSD